MKHSEDIARLIRDLRFEIRQKKSPQEAIVESHDGHTLHFRVPSFDNSHSTFGPVAYIHPLSFMGTVDTDGYSTPATYYAMSKGDRILVVQDNRNGWWVIAP